MQENGILDDGKTQTGATHLAAASLIYPIETLEKTGEMLGRNSLAIITEDEMPLIALLLGTQRYLTPFAGISYGIVGKIAEHTVEQTAVTLHDNMLVGKKILKSHLVRLSFERRLTGYFSHHLRNVYRLEIYHIRTVIQPVQG